MGRFTRINEKILFNILAMDFLLCNYKLVRLSRIIRKGYLGHFNIGIATVYIRKHVKGLLKLGHVIYDWTQTIGTCNIWLGHVIYDWTQTICILFITVAIKKNKTNFINRLFVLFVSKTRLSWNQIHSFDHPVHNIYY